MVCISQFTGLNRRPNPIVYCNGRSSWLGSDRTSPEWVLCCVSVSWCQGAGSDRATRTGTPAAASVSVRGPESQVIDWSAVWSSGLVDMSSGAEVTLVMSVTFPCDRPGEDSCVIRSVVLLSGSTDSRSVKGLCPALTVTGERKAVWLNRSWSDDWAWCVISGRLGLWAAGCQRHRSIGLREPCHLRSRKTPEPFP